MNPEPGTAAGLRDEVRENAEAVSHTAKERLHGEVDARKGAAAEQAQSLSSALDAAADKLGPDTPNWLRSAFEQGSQTLQRLAQTVDQKDSRQLARDVQQLARNNPGTFLAGCALAGFAAARIFKAGASEQGGSAGGGSAAELGYQSYGGQAGTSQAGSGQGYPAQPSLVQGYSGQPSTGGSSSDYAGGSSGGYASGSGGGYTGGLQPQSSEPHTPAGGVV